MTVTDYAGVLGLVAAALVAFWMLTGTHGPRASARHSAPPTDEPHQPMASAGAARHRATSGGLLQRILR
ncbi:hypothetical protein FB561_1748 [Kribbella amoyensis]|uniref:Uncharacterized protein n=1 Tax=Kribbella amoyensis TaxID=996641 RepID=A0A561BP71_9ACTN|nr:hypothetical protein [Kribbella amoyensis]TWD80661.1 hypothetical protein FB561_1748 [Kribbella amoyensis]